MAKSINVNDNGFTILHEAPHSAIDVVFVHGFTGHPKDTWTCKRASKSLTKQPKRRDRDGEHTDTARRSKIPRLPFARLNRTASSPAPSGSQTDRSLTDETRCNDSDEFDNTDRSDVFWPADLLCDTIPHSRILTYGYDTKVRHWLKGNVSKNTVYDHAWDLLCSLEAIRRETYETPRPVLFVAHSLGGVVVKEALQRSRGCVSTKPHLYNIFKATVGVMFFGTPHRGADPRSFLHHVLSASLLALGAQVNNQIVSCLMPQNERLTKLRDEFSLMCLERRWQVYSFQEEYGVKALFGKKVVDDESSCLDNPAIETKQHISSNHMDMCRFSGARDPEYAKVAAALTFIVGNIKDATALASSPQSSGQRQSIATPFPIQDKQVGPETPVAYGNTSLFPEIRNLGERSTTGASGTIDDATKLSLIEQLYFAKIDERLTNLEAAQGKTCRWFLGRPEYTSWRDTGDVIRQSEHNGFLWIKGHPGTGKSTLMKLLFEDTKLRTKVDPLHITLSFFFLARGTIEERTTLGLYRSLLHQLFQKSVDLKDSLDWMTVDGARGVQRTGWHEEALKQTLMHAIRNLGNRSLTVFVDALDECDENQATRMVSFFEELCDHAKEVHIQLRICLSSRHYPTIVVEEGIEITLENQIEHTEDIRQYIKSKLKIGKSKQAELLQAEILEKSCGIFLWVVLVLDILNNEYPNKFVSIKAMRNRLNDIPPELNDLFEMIITRDNDNLECMRVCLIWILFATRPLKPQELYFAVQLTLDNKCSTFWDSEDVDLEQMKIFVRSSSKGLAEVTRNKASEIQFIHESVRDFLLGRYSTSWSHTSGNLIGHSHNTLRDCCLAQIGVSVSQKTVDLTKPRLVMSAKAVDMESPFFRYSILNVLRHADSAQQHGIEQDGFLADFIPRLEDWIASYNTFEKFENRRYTDTANFLYILAEMNLANLIRIHPQNLSGFDISSERYGPPLFAALATGGLEAVEALVSAQIQRSPICSSLCSKLKYDIRTHKYASWRREFAYSSQRGVVSHLIKQDDEILILAYICTWENAVINTDVEDVQRLLWSALEKGQEGVVELLVGTVHISIFGLNKSGQTAFSYAAQKGFEGIVRSLLATGLVDINSKDQDRRSPLSHAAREGHERIVQLLLATNLIDVNLRDRHGRTPLLFAVRYGHVGIVRRLLETEHIIVDSKDNNNMTPVASASRNGHDTILQLLLARSQVDVNLYATESIEIPSALGLACLHDGGTPLVMAARNGHEVIVRQLLAIDQVDINLTCDRGRTPLSYAADGGHESIVQQILVKDQVNIHLTCGRGRTPLSYAARRGNKFIVQQILAKDQVDVNLSCNDGRTPLSYAAEGGHKSIVQQLLDIDQVNVNLSCNDGRTPLSYAAGAGHESIVRRLLATKKVWITEDNIGWSPSEHTEDRGIIRLLDIYIATNGTSPA